MNHYYHSLYHYHLSFLILLSLSIHLHSQAGTSPSLLPGFVGRILRRTGWESDAEWESETRVFGQSAILKRLGDFLSSSPRQVCIVSAPNNAVCSMYV